MERMRGKDWKRRLEWALKSRLTASPPVRTRVADVDAYAYALPAAARRRWEELVKRYPSLIFHLQGCPADAMRESVYVLDVLHGYAPTAPAHGRCLDIGCRNWAYLPGLRTFATLPWHGVELDAHQRYLDLTTRRAHGEAMAARFQHCRYFARSLLDMRGEYSLITWLLPFVHPAALQSWGLPDRYFQPQVLLEHALARLGPGGGMFIVNQGEAERELQARLLAQQPWPARDLGELACVLSPFRSRRFGWWIERPAISSSR